MVIGWFVLLALQIYDELFNDAQPKSVAWLGEAGAVLFGAAWLWSLVTSLSLLREARGHNDAETGTLLDNERFPGSFLLRSRNYAQICCSGLSAPAAARAGGNATLRD